MAAPSRLPVPDSAAATHRTCGNAPSRDWFDGRPKNASFSLLSGTSVTDPSIETTRSPQQNTPGAPSAPVGPATCSNSIRTGSAPSFAAPARQRGDVRLLPPPARPGVHPAVRVQLPGQQVRAAPLVVQPVGQLGHHLPVPAVPAPEQPQREHEVHHQPGRQQPAPLLPRPRHLDGLIDQLRRERPGQHPDRDPVRQPPVRRQTLRTIMSHKTVTLPHHALRQGHWPYAWARPPVSWHAIVPFTFRILGQPLDPEISPLISARCAGDITLRLVAQQQQSAAVRPSVA